MLFSDVCSRIQSSSGSEQIQWIKELVSFVHGEECSLALKQFRKILRTGSWQARQCVVALLATVPGDEPELLICSAAADTDREVRVAVCYAIRVRGVSSVLVRATLKKLAADPEWLVRMTALNAVQHLPGFSLSYLFVQAQNDPHPAVRASLPCFCVKEPIE